MLNCVNRVKAIKAILKIERTDREQHRETVGEQFARRRAVTGLHLAEKLLDQPLLAALDVILAQRMGMISIERTLCVSGRILLRYLNQVLSHTEQFLASLVHVAATFVTSLSGAE